MKIGIDISQVVYETGVSTYTENLVRGLSEVDNRNEYKLFAGSLRRRGDFTKFIKSIKNNNFKAIVYPLPPTFLNFLWNKIHFYEIENILGEIDIFHSSDWTQPPTRKKSVTTIHDLVPILHPEWSYKKIIDAHKSRLSWVKKEVDMIISPTKTTRQDLVSLGFSETKIKVIPEAPDPIFKPATRKQVKGIKEKLEIEGKFILSIGVNPRKNLKNTIKAFKTLRKNDPNLNLVVIGHKYEDVPLSKGVIFTGHVEKKELPIFYTGAECLLYPSLYEGFGLPILEAFSCKTPVVTSNRSSMKEVAGDAAILVDPLKVGEIGKGVEKAMDNKKELIKKGITRVKRFSWDETANKTLKLYEKLAK